MSDWGAWLRGRWRRALIATGLAVPRSGERARTAAPPDRPSWMREEVAWTFRVGFVVVAVFVLDGIGLPEHWSMFIALVVGLPLGGWLVWHLPDTRITRDPRTRRPSSAPPGPGSDVADDPQ
ncbi:MAG: hypothetical protein AAGC46_01565 [Solirubrobacteraceae bacterium]|nr:hypothetical protein [Patulibacter sp.]